MADIGGDENLVVGFTGEDELAIGQVPWLEAAVNNCPVSAIG